MNNRGLQGLFLLGSLTLIGCSSTDGISTDNADSQASVEVKSADAASIATWIDQSVLMPQGLSLETEKIRYMTGSADLNSDGSAEHFVLLQDRYFCGSGGCAAYMFDNSGKVINRMSVTRTPVVLADSYSNGWQDFIVWSNGAYRQMSFNGESYPSNPSLEPKVDRDTNVQAAIAYVMATELYQQDGYDILPADDKEIWTPANIYHFTFKHYGDPHSVYQATVNIDSGDVDIESVPMQ
ncbi:hypothetical protein DA096_23035 [Vibrio rotiferianus]|uniref:hypothetical protein n=1 Tax=Vibrio rotiferianus TaxID=190895 RepID=UPI0011101168|nr:hypothetical protein [Vibrio rotiferianus]TMX31382.1 hypothetical protein DA095_25280 [Vibrio rotiferianus]TMX43017.1 hypothetical protein DA093_23065 [Vibrio rotiferianus]TMX60067.1 hypothetical protein DA096_23035 [Vibrio rotiferianus]